VELADVPAVAAPVNYADAYEWAILDGGTDDASSIGDVTEGATSIAGDSHFSEEEERYRDCTYAPADMVGLPYEEEETPLEPAKMNSELEVGNMGLLFGSLGLLPGKLDEREKVKRRETAVREMGKSPAAIHVVLASTWLMEVALSQAAVAGEEGKSGVAGRPTCPPWVLRAQEEQGVLIACRVDLCTRIKTVDYNVFKAFYRDNGKKKQGKSRMFTCMCTFKQNVGHIGKHVVIMGAHGHSHLMKGDCGSTKLNKWLDHLAAVCKKDGVHYLLIDANMCLPYMVEALRSRGLEYTTVISWYPWINKETKVHNQRWGFDSQAMFWVGPQPLSVWMPWNLEHVDILSAVADDQQVLLEGSKVQLPV